MAEPDYGRQQEASVSFADFAREIENHYRNLVAKTSAVPKDIYEHWQAFVSAVNWNERWLQGLILSEVLLLVIVVSYRNSAEMQSIIFLSICALIFFSERINSYCASNWQMFSTQNYFDEHGSFAVTLFSGPLLFIALIQVILVLRLTAAQLIIAKKLELKNKRLQEQKDTSNQITADNSSNQNLGGQEVSNVEESKKNK